LVCLFRVLLDHDWELIEFLYFGLIRVLIQEHGRK
jgi:hypothetical protein